MIFSLVLLLAAASTTAWGANSPASVTVSITAQQSSDLNANPSNVGNNWVYSYTIYDGQSVTDTLPVQYCVTAQDVSDNLWSSFDLHFGPNGQGGNLSDAQVTAPADKTFNFVDANTLPSCQTVYVYVDTGTLSLSNPAVAQNFDKNFNIAAINLVPNNHFNVSLNQTPDNLKVQITVLPLAGSHVSCFITDSSGNFLTDCSGQDVSASGSLDGRFAIVVNNKKAIQVATNPGQFYYNFLWQNTTGASQTVTVSFARTGVNPQGAQAIHALAFAPPFSGISVDDFNAVNEGLPGGSDDLIENIIVPDGWTLWVDYHLEWSGIGGSSTGVPSTCGGVGASWTVTGTVSGTGVSTESCTAGASGYKK